MRKRFYLSISLLFMVSCSGSMDSIGTLRTEFTGQKQAINLPDDWGQFNLRWILGPDGSWCLYNYQKFELFFGNITDLKNPTLILLEKEGPNGIDGIGDIQIGPQGEIWVLGADNQISRINKEGRVMERINLPMSEFEEKGVTIMNFSFIVGEDAFFFSSLPLIFQWNQLAKEEILEMPNMVKYVPESQKMEGVSYFSNEFIGDNLNKIIIPTIHKGENKRILINHNFKDIWVFDGKEINTHKAAHSQFPNEPPSSSVNIFEDMNEIMRLLNYTDIYTDIHFFKELSLYARVAKFEDIPENSDFYSDFLASKWGLVFLDKNFNKVGEMILPENRYNPQFMFSTDEGIWISLNHPSYLDLEEGNLEFELLEVKF